MVRNTEKVIIKVGRGVRLTNLPNAAVDKLIRDLTFDNLKYKQALEHGKYVGGNVDPFVYFFARSTNGKTYWTPRGYIWFIKKWLRDNGYPVELQDNTLTLPEIDVEFKATLRDYQKSAVDEVARRYPVGVLEAATGAGKTVMGTALIAKRKQRAIVLVHNKELLYQWQEAIRKFLGYDAGLLGDNKFQLRDISVGIINTVRNKIDEISEQFGHVIVDECHRCPAGTWSDTLPEFPAKYYLGLSATPFRKDGLGNAIYYNIGPKLHKVDLKKLQDTGAVLKPQIILAKTQYHFGRHYSDCLKVPYATVIKDLTNNQQRNDLIARLIKDDLRQYKQNVLVVSDRVTHCEQIANMLYSKGVMSRILHGKVSATDRARIVNDVKTGKCKVLIATLSLIGEGFDAPNLAALFLTTPIKFSGRLIQTVGRVLRPEEGKTPRVYDFRDENVEILKYSGYARNTIYKKQWS